MIIKFFRCCKIFKLWYCRFPYMYILYRLYFFIYVVDFHICWKVIFYFCVGMFCWIFNLRCWDLPPKCLLILKNCVSNVAFFIKHLTCIADDSWTAIRLFFSSHMFAKCIQMNYEFPLCVCAKHKQWQKSFFLPVIRRVQNGHDIFATPQNSVSACYTCIYI